MSFIVGSCETADQAVEHYKVQLLAIAAALKSLPCAAAEQRNIAELRHMAAHTNTAWTSENVIPDGKDYLSDFARMAPDEFHNTSTRFISKRWKSCVS